MKSIIKNLFIIVFVIGVFASCEIEEEDDSDSYEDHVPTDDMGSLVIYNMSAVEMAGYFDGTYIGNIETGEWEIEDYEPGTYTVVVIEDDGSKSYTADVEILDGVLTVLTMSYGESSTSDFSASTEYIEAE